MIKEDWLFLKLKEYKEIFSESELWLFLSSIRRSKVIAKSGYLKSFYRLEKIEKRIQWPVWKKLHENNLLEIIFPGKKDATDKLVQLLEIEKKILSQKGSISDWRFIVHERIKLYSELFGFSEKDRKWIKRKTAIYEKRLDVFLRKKEMKQWAIAGGVLLGGAAAFYGGKKIYDHIKDKK